MRSAYHGGQINGVGIKQLMDHAESIMADIEKVLVEALRRRHDAAVTEEEVKRKCKAVKHFFALWDDAFAAVHLPDPAVQDCNDAQEKINRAMKQMRSMEMSITPKAHGMEDHVVNQMRKIPGGIVRMIEHWVERYHQVGFKYDDKWRRLRGEKRKAEIRSTREHIAANVHVVKRLKALIENCSRGKRSATLLREETRKRMKTDKRAKDVTQWLRENSPHTDEVDQWLAAEEESGDNQMETKGIV